LFPGGAGFKAVATPEKVAAMANHASIARRSAMTRGGGTYQGVSITYRRKETLKIRMPEEFLIKSARIHVTFTDKRNI
jgi:hypothetical protein